MKIINIVKKLYPYDYSVASEGSDKAIQEFKKFLNFKNDTVVFLKIIIFCPRIKFPIN